MNAPPPIDRLRPPPPTAGPTGLPAAHPLRMVWESRYGAMVIEVDGEVVFVNGQRVEPATRLWRAEESHS